jgi:hypothetical protein
MFIVRETFTAKPGMASKLAAQFKDVMHMMPELKSRVLTDHVAAFNTVVLEVEVESLGEFDQRMADYFSRADIRERMKGYTEMYVTGRREIYKVV